MFANMPFLTTLRLPKNVTKIGDYALYNNQKLTEVTIQEGVLSIGEYSFGKYMYSSSNPLSLKHITLPSTLQTINDYAFHYSALEEVVIPESVTSIGVEAFVNSKNLKTVHLPDGLKNIARGCFYGCKMLETINMPSALEEISSYAFYSCSALKEVNLPAGLKTIDSQAFDDCDVLTLKSGLPAGLTTLGSSAFSGCNGLTAITLPASIKVVPSSAFYNCKNLKKVTLATGTTKIESSAFSYCESLDDINTDAVASTLTTIGSSAFHNTGFTAFTINEGVTSLGSSAFSSCKNLKSINIPTAITTVPSSFVNSCTALESVTLHNGITKIENSAFTSCYKLKLTALPSALQTIGSYAFSACNSLTQIVLPASVTNIEYQAFYSCEALESVTFQSAPTLSTDIFHYCKNLTDVVMHNDMKTITQSMFAGCVNLANINMPSKLTTIDGYAFQSCKALAEITIPNGVTEIGSYAFQNCESLTKVVVPNSVTKLGSDTFTNCKKLEEASLGSSVNYANNNYFDYFNGCASLKKLTIGAGTPPKIYSNYNTYRTNCDLYVPEDMVDTYKATDLWKDFKSISGYFAGDILAADEYAAMKNIYAALNGANWTKPWNLETNHHSIGKWAGVTTAKGKELAEGGYEYHITAIDLHGAGLKGTIPVDFFRLSELTTLNLNNNNIKGVITTLLNSLDPEEGDKWSNSKITEMDFSGNELTGDIAPFVNRFKALVSVNFNYNRLTDISEKMENENFRTWYSSNRLRYNYQFMDYTTHKVIEAAVPKVYDCYIGKEFEVEFSTMQTYNYWNMNWENIPTNGTRLYNCYNGSSSDPGPRYPQFISDKDGKFTLGTDYSFYGKKNVIEPYVVNMSYVGYVPLFLRVDWTDGDANCDLAVDALDLSSVIYYAMHDGRPSSQVFNYSCADENGDNTIDVYDVVNNVNRVLAAEETVASGSEGKRRSVRRLRNANEASADDYLLWISKDGSLNIASNYDEVSTLSMTICDANAQNLYLTPKHSNHFTLATRQMGNDVRVVVYSLSGQTLPEGNCSLIGGLEHGAKIRSVVIADNEARELLAAIVSESDITGIEGVKSDDQTGSSTYGYDLSGRKVNGGHRGITISGNGKKIIK